MNQTQSLILCEGYHDRAFWAGWLEHLGCSDPAHPKGKELRRIRVIDPWGKSVMEGHFGFWSKSDRFLKIVPCRGKDQVRKAAKLQLDPDQRTRLDRLVINLDPDTESNDASEQPSEQHTQNDLAWVQKIEPKAQLDDNGDILLDEGKTIVSHVWWETSEESNVGLPTKQTLERLVCAAIVAAYPDRAKPVSKWLESRPNKPPECPKEFSWSYMAGWYAKNGCDDFFRAVWRDKKVAKELQTRLEASGGWRVAEALAS